MAEQPFLSQNWYRVAGLKPRLKAHADIGVHRYLGRIWYVMRESASTRVHRMSPAGYAVIGLLDGQTTVDEAWRLAAERLGDDAPTQDEAIHLLVQLYRADLLTVDMAPQARELFERQRKQRRNRWMRSVKNPMSITLPLVDPDRLLTAIASALRWLPFWLIALAWLAVTGMGAGLAVLHYRELAGNLNDQLWSMQNLLLIAVLFIGLKIIHELGHGIAAKAFGTDVREAGIMLLVFYPVPYVEVSDSIFIASKWRRILIGAAGMMAELFVAAVAMMLWLAVEDSALRAALFNIMLIAGISTVLVNGNPLLRFDGYYMLADWLEMPNLGQRSNRWWGALVERHGFGRRNAAPEQLSLFEKTVMLLYAPAAYVCRVAVLLGIAFFVASEYLAVGVLVGAWALITGIVAPAWKALKHVFTAPVLNLYRARAITVTLAAILALVLGFAMLPLPSRSTADAVVWLPDSAIVRAEASGFITRVHVEAGQEVRAGTMIGQMEDPTLAARIDAQRHKVTEFRLKVQAESVSDQSKLEIARKDLQDEDSALARLEQRAHRLVILAAAEGRFHPAAPGDSTGRLVKEGEVIGHIVPTETRQIRIVVDQADIDRVRLNLAAIEIVPGAGYRKAIGAVITREVPAGRQQLPHRAFGSSGGGAIPVDPRDQNGLNALRRFFQFDVEAAEVLAPASFGGRVHVRFSYRWEPAGTQLLRRVRQLFLTSLHA